MGKMKILRISRYKNNRKLIMEYLKFILSSNKVYYENNTHHASSHPNLSITEVIKVGNGKQRYLF